jgi:hypothetical protein
VSGHRAVPLELVSYSYDCQAFGCTNTARSQRGPWAYCDEHRGKEVEKKPRKREQYRDMLDPGASFSDKLHHLRNLARNADRARAKARRATIDALAAKQSADETAAAFYAACRQLAVEEGE